MVERGTRPVRRAVVGAAVVALCIVGAASAAGAEAVDHAEFERRITAVQNNPDDQQARDAVAAITEVDGQIVRLEPLVEGSAREVADRLALLDGTSADAVVADVAVEDARSEAERILADRDFQDKRAPAPFRGVLRWVGERLEPLGRPFAGLVRNSAVQWTFMSAALAAATAAMTVIARRRLRSPSERRRSAAAASHLAPLDPTNLEADADVAERDGNHERALRLRFVAGLVRLEALDEVHGVEATPTNELRRELASVDFDTVAADFDAIVYGDRPATAADSERAREGWARILTEHKR